MTTASIAWVRELARPYLRGYRAQRQSTGALRGYWFSRPAGGPNGQAGFFVGYLAGGEGFEFMRPEPPECLVFAYVRPLDGALHRRLIDEKEGLGRKTFEYIRWLTHRPPRFQFFDRHLPALVRHHSLREWPVPSRERHSRNFFIETLAWLVRSGLVRKLGEETATRSRATKAAKRLRSPQQKRKPRRSR